MAQGGKREGAGRPKGVPNKVTQQAKEAIEYAFNGLGGAEGLLEWAQSDPANQKIFYSQVWTKILPKDMTVSNPDGSPVLSGISITFKDASGS